MFEYGAAVPLMTAVARVSRAGSSHTVSKNSRPAMIENAMM
jgi:hypothetical protein